MRTTSAGCLAWMCALATMVAAPPSRGQEAAVEFARTHATPLAGIEPGSNVEDLAVIERAIGSARVIAYSEGWHASHEFLAFRNRLFVHLVERGMVTAYAGETGFTDAVAADDYILGRTPFSDEAARAVFAWGTRPMLENRQLIEWMRAYNARPTTSRPLRFYGVDLTGGVDFKRASLAVDAVLAYVRTVDAAWSQDIEKRLKPHVARFNTLDYPSLSPAERAELTLAIGDIERLFASQRLVWIARSSALGYERAARNAAVVRQLNDAFRARLDAAVHLPPKHVDREPGMAENLRWVLEREGPQGRVFFFAQVGHHAKTWPTVDAARRPPVGAYLHSMLSDEMIVIAGLWGGGEVGPADGPFRPLPPMQVGVYGALDKVLPQVAGPLFFLDLREMPPLQTDAFEGKAADFFDAVVFFREIGPLHRYR